MRITKAEADAILAEVKANHARLAACVGPHGFQPISKDFMARFECIRCHGTVSADQGRWYQRGLAHGRNG